MLEFKIEKLRAQQPGVTVSETFRDRLILQTSPVGKVCNFRLTLILELKVLWSIWRKVSFSKGYKTLTLKDTRRETQYTYSILVLMAGSSIVTYPVPHQSRKEKNGLKNPPCTTNKPKRPAGMSLWRQIRNGGRKRSQRLGNCRVSINSGFSFWS